MHTYQPRKKEANYMMADTLVSDACSGDVSNDGAFRNPKVSCSMSPDDNVKIVSMICLLSYKIYAEVFMWLKSREPLSTKFLKESEKNSLQLI